MSVISHLEPKDVFSYFEEICSIPHGSGNMQKISEYCCRFAEKYGLEYFKDELNNVIIKKPASTGYESHEAVVLQGHLDMVCEKEADYPINFETDPLELELNGDFISAKGTSLGGDDGVAVAMILAILADSGAVHPAIEAVFTTDEETGMYGAEALDVSHLSGKTLINIDSEKMGVLTVSCAGGARTDLSLTLECEKIDAPCYEIVVGGLIGGHSGVEIDKGRLNANKILGEFLKTVGQGTKIISIEGGNKDNVIPSVCRCTLSGNADFVSLTKKFTELNKTLTDPGLYIKVIETEPCESGLTIDSTQKVVNFINELPSGVVKMSEDIDGLVQTSLNLGVLTLNSTCLRATFAVRSSVKKEKDEMISKLKSIAENYGGDFSSHGDYPAWEYRKKSPLRDIMASTYCDMFGEQPQVVAIHAGLECGMFAEKMGNFDAVSIGPDMYDIHSVNERLSVSSTRAIYEYLKEVLKRL